MAHYYQTDGTPQHFLGPRKSTSLREARKFDLIPSVTTVLGIVDKPALVNWLQEEAAMTAASMLAHCKPELMATDRQWAKSVCSESRKKTMAKADSGTAIHSILERWFKGERVGIKDVPMCEAVNALLIKHCGLQQWIPEATVVSTEYGFAGKVDLHCNDYIVDFKTKDHVDDSTKGYREQADQLAAYRYALGFHDAKLVNVFISRSDGAIKYYQHNDDMAWERFKATLQLWQISKKYGVHYERVIA